MADYLENMLLEAAGRIRHSRPRSRRTHVSGDDRHNYSGWQVPLKKRSFASNEIPKKDDDDDVNDSNDEVVNNENNKRKLSEKNVTATKSDEKGKTIEPVKQTPPLPSSIVRSSSISGKKLTARDGALNELRLKRLKQQDSEAKRRVSEASRSSRPVHVSVKHKPPPSTSSSSSSDSERTETDTDTDGSSGHNIIIDNDDDDKIMLGSEGVSFEDIKKITIRRSKLAKWFMEPFFEELIVGCFVRAGIGMSKSGPVYKLCMVKNVDATDCARQYKFENKTTHKYLNLFWGNETRAERWQMAMVSNSPPLEEEFKQWIKEVRQGGGSMPMKQEVEEKKEAIQKISLFVYSAATVKQMLQEKKYASSRPLNIAAEKDRLKTEMEIALSEHNKTEVERIMKRLQELDECRQAKEKDVNVKALRLTEMNRKNRFENFKNASELKPIKTSLKVGEAGYDPFSRRWTRSRNYYAAKHANKEVEDGNNGVSDAVDGASNYQIGAAETVAATAAALEAAADAGKLVDTSAPVDKGTESNSLHNFELPISLAMLQNFGGAQGARAGLLARKQRMEATMGSQVLEDDGKKHALTLSISDYKRKKGRH